MVAEVQRSEPKLFAGPFHKSSSGCVRMHNWHHGEGTWRDSEKRTPAVLFVGLLQEHFSFGKEKKLFQLLDLMAGEVIWLVSSVTTNT